MLNVLLTNDDGIEAEGLQALRRALLAVLEASSWRSIAPDGNRSAMARSITTRRPLWVERGRLRRRHASATRPTARRSTACGSRSLGLIEGFEAELVVSGINHGANLGDDITYSGTVAAALEGVRARPAGDRRLPAVAARARSTSASTAASTSTSAAAFVARLVERIEDVPLPRGTLLNVNVPGGRARAASRSRASASASTATSSSSSTRRSTGRRYWIYGSDPGFHDEPGTDLAAVAAGRIAVTPIHFDLTDRPGLEALQRLDLDALLAPADRASGRAPRRAVSAARRGHGRARARRSCAASSSTTRHRYYVLDDPEIGDDEYDALLDELRAIEARASRAA